MERGDATCPGAAWGLAKAIEEDHGYATEIVGGEFEGGWAHYWVEVGVGQEKFIADIGNNAEAIETGKLRPILVPVDSDFGKKYRHRDERYGTPKEFFQEQKNSPWARKSLALFVGKRK